MTIYIASSNPGKLRDFQAIANRHSNDLTIAVLPGLATIQPPPEDELTFADNAIAKAVYYSNLAPGLFVLADDSGLEVDALGGAPGVRSARYAEDMEFKTTSDTSTDERNNAALLQALEGVQPRDRTARFRCVLAVARDGETLHQAEGSCEGLILASPRGDLGFGYDPLFFLPNLNLTLAEMTADKKQEYSHRGQAFNNLLTIL